MPTASNILCGCGRFMRVKQNSVTVEERTEDQQPYKLWDADLYECVECGVEIIAGFARQPLAEHYQPTYAAMRERLAPIYPGRCREEANASCEGGRAAMNDDRTLEDRSGSIYDPESDDCGEVCWYCHGEGGWHDCGEDTCPCLYHEEEPQDYDWYDYPDCNGSGML